MIERLSLAKSVEYARLNLSLELCDLLVGSTQLDIRNLSEVEVSADLIKTYELRLDHVSRRNDAISRNLVITTTEMLQNMETSIGQSFCWLYVEAKVAEIRYIVGYRRDVLQVLFIHKVLRPRELTELEKESVKRGAYVQVFPDGDY